MLTSEFGSLEKSMNHEQIPEYYDKGIVLQEMHSSFDHIRQQNPRPVHLRNSDLAEDSLVRNGSSEAENTTSNRKHPFAPA
mmetsp:Transcript_30573/g.46878  ORF Transcript_30573/g.46878 Transcript_30573/m.46878 type:complete len:81 (+) Transcript_30573:1625-1867(+)